MLQRLKVHQVQFRILSSCSSLALMIIWRSSSSTSKSTACPDSWASACATISRISSISVWREKFFQWPLQLRSCTNSNHSGTWIHFSSEVCFISHQLRFQRGNLFLKVRNLFSLSLRLWRGSLKSLLPFIIWDIDNSACARVSAIKTVCSFSKGTKSIKSLCQFFRGPICLSLFPFKACSCQNLGRERTNFTIKFDSLTFTSRTNDREVLSNELKPNYLFPRGVQLQLLTFKRPVKFNTCNVLLFKRWNDMVNQFRSTFRVSRKILNCSKGKTAGPTGNLAKVRNFSLIEAQAQLPPWTLENWNYITGNQSVYLFSFSVILRTLDINQFAYKLQLSSKLLQLLQMMTFLQVIWPLSDKSAVSQKF